jgi:hypothetical protein
MELIFVQTPYIWKVHLYAEKEVIEFEDRVMEITENIYNAALARIEELLPLVNDDTSPANRYAVELKIMSDIVIEHETAHFPI